MNFIHKWFLRRTAYRLSLSPAWDNISRDMLHNTLRLSAYRDGQLVTGTFRRDTVEALVATDAVLQCEPSLYNGNFIGGSLAYTNTGHLYTVAYNWREIVEKL